MTTRIMDDTTTLSSFAAKHDDSISYGFHRVGQPNKTNSEKDSNSGGERSSPILLTNNIMRKRRSNVVVEDPQSQQQQQRSNDHLKSINSGFLAGLFDDVTKMNVLKEFKISSCSSSSPDTTNTIVVEERHSTNNGSGDFRKEISSAAQITTRPATAAATRTVSPSTHNNPKEVETTTTTPDPLHLLDSSATTSSAGWVSMTSSSFSCCFSNTTSTCSSSTTNSRPAKKSRLPMIKVPSLTGLHASTESMRGNLERVSYWNLTERSAILQEQSRELFQTCISSSAAGVGGHDDTASQSNATTTTTQTRETSLNRLFSQVSFLDDAQQHGSASMMAATNSSFQPEQITIAYKDSNNNSCSNPATLALDALTGACTTTKKHLSRMIKASTLNRFPILPYTISATSCDNNTVINDARRRTKLTRSNPTFACDTMSGSNNSNSDEGAFGWFVDTDDDHDDSMTTTVAPSTAAVASTVEPSCTSGGGGDDLAFQAPTAPKGRSIQGDAEVEWAQAADTVDSVLGDMF